MKAGNCELCGHWDSRLEGAVCTGCDERYGSGQLERNTGEKSAAPDDVKFMAAILIDSVRSKSPDLVIGPKEDPYLIRWWLRREREMGSIYLHCICRDDDDRALHDRPWPSTSVILSGTLREVLPGSTRLLGPGSITSRGAEQAHRLEVVNGPVWSLFITGAVEREWGFHCPKGWVPWEIFTSPNDSGLIGRGCE